MPVVSDKEIATYALIPDVEREAVAVAVALAESGGDTSTRHVNSNGSIDVGLWQINSVHRSSNPTWTEAWLKDPAHNAEAMRTVSGNGTNWAPWVGYSSGAYKQYLNRGRSAAGAVQGKGSVTDAVGAAIEDPLGVFSGVLGDPLGALAAMIAPFTKIVEPVLALASWVGNPANWIRIVQVNAGVGLVLIAAAAVFASSRFGQNASQQAVSVLPIPAAAKGKLR